MGAAAGDGGLGTPLRREVRPSFLSENIVHRWAGDSLSPGPEERKIFMGGSLLRPQAPGRLWPLHHRLRGPAPLRDPPCNLGQLAWDMEANPGATVTGLLLPPQLSAGLPGPP